MKQYFFDTNYYEIIKLSISAACTCPPHNFHCHFFFFFYQTKMWNKRITSTFIRYLKKKKGFVKLKNK